MVLENRIMYVRGELGLSLHCEWTTENFEREKYIQSLFLVEHKISQEFIAHDMYFFYFIVQMQFSMCNLRPLLQQQRMSHIEISDQFKRTHTHTTNE